MRLKKKGTMQHIHKRKLKIKLNGSKRRVSFVSTLLVALGVMTVIDIIAAVRNTLAFAMYY